jgi:PAS domain S-box-containing protein
MRFTKFSKAQRYTLILSLIGLALATFTFFIQQNLLRTSAANIPLSTLAKHVSADVTRAHLWLEELMKGDNSVTFEKNVLELLTSSRDVLQGAYDGKESVIGNFEKSDVETRALIKETIIDVDKLAESAKDQWLSRGQSDSTSEKEQAFDNLYIRVTANLSRLESRLAAQVNDGAAVMNVEAWLMLALVVISFLLIGYFTFILQSKNDREQKENVLKLSEETKRAETLSTFIEAVSAGNYNIELQKSSDDDSLIGTLVAMRDKLQQNAEEDRRRNWSTTGLAQIGEILRATNTSTTELYDNIIRFIVKYTKSNQGGLFILNDDDENKQFLELLGCYAFERKKFLTKKVDVGSGLVGQCYLEGQSIYLLEVPAEYVNITSGLGGTNPNAVLLVPLKVNEKVYGVLELASFRKYQDYEIELVEKLAETIAATISSVKVNETTRMLLERTQQQAEEMKSQEEEIRQNMEELEATQEEMRRKQTILEKELEQSQAQAQALKGQEKKLKESQDTLQAIVDNIPRAIFWKDKDLRFIGCNRIFASIAGLSVPSEIIGKTDFDMVWSAQADAYRKDDLEVMRSRKAKLDIEEVNVNSVGEESWVLTSKVPIVNQNEEVVAVLGMFEDITARKKKESDIAKKLEERESAMKELRALKQMMETTRKV